MNLLEDIQNAATDSASDVGALLRKCKILATRLENQQLENWVIWESNGYPNDISVPNYRVWPLEVKGHFLGPFNSGLRNAPIPTILLPENLRKSYTEYECKMSVSAIESAIEGNTSGMLQISTNNLAVTLGTKVYENMNCLQCWAEFGVMSLVEVLNAVRNRVLDFSLALWKENPNAGETNSNNKKRISSDKITQIFNTTIHGGTANLVGSANNSSVQFNIGLNDFESVRRAFQNNGMSKNDIADLEDALKQDERPQSAKKFGANVSSWIARMMKKASEGTWDISIAAAGELLADIISKYYGLQ